MCGNRPPDGLNWQEEARLFCRFQVQIGISAFHKFLPVLIFDNNSIFRISDDFWLLASTYSQTNS